MKKFALPRASMKLLTVASLFASAPLAQAAAVSFDFVFSGAMFGNTATAVGSITVDDSIFANTSSTFSQYYIGGPEVLSLDVTVSGASTGNGYFGMNDFSSIDFNTQGGMLDPNLPLIGQPTNNAPWGSYCGGFCSGDFNLFANTSGAPTGTWFFILSAGGYGDQMYLTSMTPTAPQPSVPVSDWTDSSQDLRIGTGGFFGRSLVLDDGDNLAVHNETIDHNGYVSQRGGAHTVNGSLHSDGRYRLTGGSLSVAGDETVGQNFGYSATVDQTGGTHTVAGTLTLGREAGGSGTYNLSGGALAAQNTVVGDAGIGTFNQSGGAHNVAQTLTLGKQGGGSGTYNLTAGILTALNEVIGDAGNGTFNQNVNYGYDSSNHIGETLTLGKQLSGSGTYNLIAGALSAKNQVIGDAGQGTLNQYGGSNTVAQTLTLGKSVTGQGFYYQNGGKLDARDLVVGDAGYGYFVQQGIVEIANTLTLARQAGSTGYYRVYTGALSVQDLVIGDAGYGGFHQGGEDFPGFIVPYDGGTVTVANAIVLGKQSSGYGYYQLLQGRLDAKDVVVGDQGGAWFGQGSYYGNPTVPQTANISGTLTVGRQQGGSGEYHLYAGVLNALNEVIGDGGSGSFTQGENRYGYSSSNHVGETLTVGRQAGGHGVYNLIAGLLSSRDTVIGDGGVGVFNQSGGNHDVAQTLTLGKQAGGEGTYDLSAGALAATNEIVGDAGTGTFTQGAGNFGYSATNTVNGTLTLGNQSGSHGIYNLVAGLLSTKGSVVGNAGTGTFNQLGGQHTVDGELTLGKQGEGVGAYNLSAGQLTTTRTVVGDAGLGVFTQSAGTHATQSLIVGRQAGGNGAYNLLDGMLNATETVVGDAGIGVFTQYGGAHNVGTLTLGKQAGSVGTYNLRGGNLNVSGDIANGAGTGSMLISGGALNFGAGNHDVDVDVFKLSGQGVVNLTDGAVATFEKAVVHNGKAINVEAGTRAIFNGAFSGKGPFTGKGTAQFNSVLNVGDGPVTFNVAGDMVLGEHSKSVLEIGGTTRGSGYDAVDVGGALNIDGELDLLTLNGFSAHAGDVFDLFSAEHITGRFDLLSLLALGEGLSWKVEYLVDAIGTKDIVRLSVVNSVPLPASVWLLQSALFGLFAARRYGRKGR